MRPVSRGGGIVGPEFVYDHGFAQASSQTKVSAHVVSGTALPTGIPGAFRGMGSGVTQDLPTRAGREPVSAGITVIAGVEFIGGLKKNAA